MPTELDRRFDSMTALITGPGGLTVIDRNWLGRAIVANQRYAH